MQRQVESLTAQLQKLTSERDEYRESLSEISEERDSLKTKVATPDAQAARIAELEAAIRDRQHYDKFAELAKEARAKEAALKHLWQVSGYKAEADEIDEKALASWWSVCVMRPTTPSTATTRTQNTAMSAKRSDQGPLRP